MNKKCVERKLLLVSWNGLKFVKIFESLRKLRRNGRDKRQEIWNLFLPRSSMIWLVPMLVRCTGSICTEFSVIQLYIYVGKTNQYINHYYNINKSISNYQLFVVGNSRKKVKQLVVVYTVRSKQFAWEGI